MRVYVAGPFRKGDQFVNVREAVLVGRRVRQSGHIPFIPHLYCLAHFIEPMPDAYWLALGMDELASCDCVLRLPGESIGSDAEVERAKVLGLRVYYGLDDFLAQAPLVRWEPAERGR